MHSGAYRWGPPPPRSAQRGIGRNHMPDGSPEADVCGCVHGVAGCDGGVSGQSSRIRSNSMGVSAGDTTLRGASRRAAQGKRVGVAVGRHEPRSRVLALGCLLTLGRLHEAESGRDGQRQLILRPGA